MYLDIYILLVQSLPITHSKSYGEYKIKGRNGFCMKLGEKPTENGRGKKDLLCPTDSYQKSQIKKVIKRAALELRGYDIDVPDNFKLYTIAVFYIEAALKYLNTKYEATRENDISLGGYINVGLSVREVNDAEKVGNINAVITLGEKGKMIVNNIRDFVEPTPEIEIPLLKPVDGEGDDIQNIQATAVKQLMTYDMFFNPTEMLLYTSVMVFLKAAIIITVMEAISKGSSIVNIGEMFSINGIVKDDELIVNCVPGADGKLLVKSDGATEDE